MTRLRNSTYRSVQYGKKQEMQKEINVKDINYLKTLADTVKSTRCELCTLMSVIALCSHASIARASSPPLILMNPN